MFYLLFRTELKVVPCISTALSVYVYAPHQRIMHHCSEMFKSKSLVSLIVHDFLFLFQKVKVNPSLWVRRGEAVLKVKVKQFVLR